MQKILHDTLQSKFHPTGSSFYRVKISYGFFLLWGKNILSPTCWLRTVGILPCSLTMLYFLTACHGSAAVVCSKHLIKDHIILMYWCNNFISMSSTTCLYCNFHLLDGAFHDHVIYCIAKYFDQSVTPCFSILVSTLCYTCTSETTVVCSRHERNLAFNDIRWAFGCELPPIF
jgi:hypothetical protein